MDNLVYHYTFVDALSGIIQNDICLWATRYDNLNDPHEQIWSKDVVLDRCIKVSNDNELTKDHFKNWFAKYSYILSLCDIPDYRNMWRLYCNDGRGVCLALDADILADESLKNSQQDPKHSFDVFEPVVYSSKNDISKAVEYWIERKIFNRSPEEPADELMNLCAFIKDSDFDIENEIRYARIRENSCVKACYNPQAEDNVEFKFYKDDTDVKYRWRNKIVPYLELHFPPNALKKINIGYQYCFEEVKPFIDNILKQYGDLYKDVKIEPSSLY